MFFRWADSTLWQQGTLVKHCKELYKAEGISNAAEPGNSSHTRFYVSKLTFPRIFYSSGYINILNVLKS